jgi:hypothetical protein
MGVLSRRAHRVTASAVGAAGKSIAAVSTHRRDAQHLLLIISLKLVLKIIFF